MCEGFRKSRGCSPGLSQFAYGGDDGKRFTYAPSVHLVREPSRFALLGAPAVALSRRTFARARFLLQTEESADREKYEK
jgi:hypothetical protein